MGKKDLFLILFSFSLLVCSAFVVAALSFAGVYFHESLRYFFSEGRFGTFYPAALLGFSSLPCFLLHIRNVPSLLYVFRRPLGEKIYGLVWIRLCHLSLDDLFEIPEIDFKRIIGWMRFLGSRKMLLLTSWMI